MASPSEPSLDCKPHSHSLLLKSFGEHPSDQALKLEEFLSRLEEERLKIDAFKRELPLCMQLLSNAVETSKQQLQAYRGNHQGSGPVLAEFIPLKNSTSETPVKTASNMSDKANWMTTAQLWSQASIETKPQLPTLTSPKETELGLNVSPKLALLDTKQRNGGAFLPFTKERNLCPSPTLALSSTELETEENKCSDLQTENGFAMRENSSNKVGNGGVMAIEPAKGSGNSSADGQATNTSNAITTSSSNTQNHRKARRCWSPDLHRRFVNALQMLGGSQVATPKQIRELMKVDGLTNDEVKSHLQKYRLHTRRPSPSPQAAGAPTPQLVVLGGIWVPPEYATAAAAAAHGGSPTLYGTHPAAAASQASPPHQFCAAPAPVPPQDFYTNAAAVPPALPPPRHPMHHHQHHTFPHQLHPYSAVSQVHNSQESAERANGERSESIEDGKSESSSWKAESGDNGGERKGLAALREEGEESNGSEITLRF